MPLCGMGIGLMAVRGKRTTKQKAGAAGARAAKPGAKSAGKRLKKPAADAALTRMRAEAQAATAQAQQAHARLREAIDILPHGLVFLDAEGRYILWNRKYAIHKIAESLNRWTQNRSRCLCACHDA